MTPWIGADSAPVNATKWLPPSHVWWDGANYQPAILRGWWDGSEIQPLASVGLGVP